MHDPAHLANRLALAYRDMDEVKRYLVAHHELDELQRAQKNSRYYDHCEALLMAAVVSYCRSFLRSNSAGKAASSLKADIFSCLTQEPMLGKLHEIIIDRRHKAIAHADWTDHHTTLIKATKSSVVRHISMPRYTEGIDPAAFLNLAQAIQTESLSLSHEIDAAP